MKKLVMALVAAGAIASLGASANAAPHHRRHHVRVCSMRHHHRVCAWVWR